MINHTQIQDEKLKSRGMAMVGVAYSIGFTFGPMIGAYMSTYARLNEGQAA